MKFALLLVCSLMLVGCTDNARAKHWGGTKTVNAPAGKTVVNMTWKEGALWVQYRDRAANETPKTTTFQEYSNLGLIEGAVVVIER